MTLNEFIEHIKHNSVTMDIFAGVNSCKFYFTGTIGTFKNAVLRSKIGNVRIVKIEPLAQSFNIFIDEGEIKNGK